MGCQDSFSRASVPAIIAFFIILLANFCNWLSFTTTSWYVVELPLDASGDVHYGLWRQCRSKLVSGCVTLDGYGDSTFAASQAFAVLGFCSINVGCLFITLYIFWDSWKRNSQLAFFTGILLLLAGLFWTITVVVFSLGYNVSGAILHYSFGLAACAGILAVITGFLMFFVGRSDAPKHSTRPLAKA